MTAWTIISLVGNGLELMEQLMELCASKDMTQVRRVLGKKKIYTIFET